MPADEPPTQQPELSITIVVWNALPRLAGCLASIADEVSSGFAEVIAADNASPDASVETVRSAFPEATIVLMDENRGFAAGVNRTWEHVRGRYWMLLNPDTLVPAGALRDLVAWMDAHPTVAIASPALADAHGGNVRSAVHPLPSSVLVFAETLRLHKLLPPRMQGRVFKGAYWTGGDTVDAGWVPGTAMIIRREAVEQVGLPDEAAFFLYGEDIDWCWRMQTAGWRIGYCSGVVVRHAESTTNLREYGSDNTLLRMAKTEFEAVRRNRGPMRARLYGAALVCSLMAESNHPRRPRQERAHTRALSKAWRQALREA
jgi:GT2 family glycosyltransferase